jgi:hypothetical protein
MFGFSVLLAVRIRRVAEIALPISWVVFGLLTVTAISVTRPYLGNWHIQCALPIATGAYACALLTWPRKPFLFARGALLVACIFGIAAGFITHGPFYYSYARSIEAYGPHSLADPNTPKPYPDTPHDLTPDLVLFLAAHGRFGHLATAAIGNPANAATFFVGQHQTNSPMFVGPNARPVRITVSLEDPVEGAQLQIGPLIVPLYRMHPTITGIDACATTFCYSAVILRRQIPDGAHAPAVWTIPDKTQAHDLTLRGSGHS